MFKYIDIEPYQPDGELTCKLLPVSEDGEKIASCLGKYVPDEIATFAKTAKSNDDWVYLHLIAMTASDFYGCNRNGDFFYETDLLGLQEPSEAAKNMGIYQGKQLPRYKTFFQASVYQHHKNKPHLGHPRFGEVCVVAYNHIMHRVELVIKVYRKNCEVGGIKYLGDPRTCERAIKGEPIAFSMGCRVPGDFCSITGRFNKTVAEYGSYLKNMMGQILSDGRRVYAINRQPRFFDISIVTIPADPLGYMLQKVASAEGITPSALLALEDGMLDDADKVANIEKKVPEGKLIGEISDSANAPDIADAGEELPDHVIDRLSNLPLHKALANALSMGIVLKPIEFAKIASNRMERSPDFMQESVDIDWSTSYDDDICRDLKKFAEKRSNLGMHSKKRMEKCASLSDDELLKSLGSPKVVQVYRKFDKPLPSGVTIGQVLALLYQTYRSKIRGGSFDQFLELVANNPHVLPAMMVSGTANNKSMDKEISKSAECDLARSMISMAVPFIGTNIEKKAQASEKIRHLKKTAALSKIQLIEGFAGDEYSESTKTAMFAVQSGLINSTLVERAFGSLQ